VDDLTLREDVEAAAPTRIDLAGGTVDLWPLYLFHPGAVTINAAIDLRARVRIERSRGRGIHLFDLRGKKNILLQAKGARTDPDAPYELFSQVLRHFSLQDGVTIRYGFEAPKGAGLAGSSALLAAFCGALMKGAGKTVSRERFLFLLRDLETRLIRVPAGMQDYYPALWGGVQALWWSAGGARREKMERDVSEELEKRILLVYTGRSRHSGTNNWAVFKRHLDGDRRVQRCVAKIVDAAQNVVQAVREADFRSVGEAMAAEYDARKKLFPGIVTPEIRALETAMKRRGATAVKVCGAGGGGCVLVYAEPEKKDALTDAVQKHGYANLPFCIAQKGLSFQRGNKSSFFMRNAC